MSGVKSVRLKLSNLLYCALAFCILASQQAAAQSQNCSYSVEQNTERFGSSQPKERCKESAATIDRVKNNQSIGEDIARKFKSDGSKVKDGRVNEHPYKNAGTQSAIWDQVWELDSKQIKRGREELGMDDRFNDCAAWHRLQHEELTCKAKLAAFAFARYDGFIYEGCCESRDSTDDPNAEEVWEFWRAENQIELNNFGISAQQETAVKRPIFVILKELLVGGALGGLRKNGPDSRPEGMKSDPHTGQSHYEGSGALPWGDLHNQYEARVVRTHHDIERAFLYKDMVEGKEERDEAWWMGECMPPLHTQGHPSPQQNKVARFAFLNSEGYLVANWRIPQLSVRRYQGADKLYKALFGQLYNLSTQVGLAYHDNTLSVLNGGQGTASAPKQNLLATHTVCSSHWLKTESDHPMDKATDNVIQGNSDEQWKRLCFDRSMGALYPLVGAVRSDVNTIAPLMAARRFMEWASWPGIDQIHKIPDRKMNYMNDRNGVNLYKDQDHKVQLGAFRLADKMQRLSPQPTGCFTMEEVNQRSFQHKGDVMREKDLGSWRFAHWNRRKGCGCAIPRGRYPGEPASRCWGRDPGNPADARLLCIGLEE